MGDTQNRDGHTLDRPQQDLVHHDNSILPVPTGLGLDRSSTTMRRLLNSTISTSRTITATAMTTDMGVAMTRDMISSTMMGITGEDLRRTRTILHSRTTTDRDRDLDGEDRLEEVAVGRWGDLHREMVVDSILREVVLQDLVKGRGEAVTLPKPAVDDRSLSGMGLQTRLVSKSLERLQSPLKAVLLTGL